MVVDDDPSARPEIPATIDREVQVFKLFRRAMSEAAKRAASTSARTGNEVLKALISADAKPVRRRRSVADRPATAVPAKLKPRKKTAGKPREGLSETLRQIKAGGMPSRPPAEPAPASQPRGASFRLGLYSSEQGRRSYKLYIPAASKGGSHPCPPMPLVVMLHGCGQTPDDFAKGTRMNALAEEFGLLVVYPGQPLGANANRCWNWFRRSDQVRDGVEPSLIAGITRKILRDHPVDPARVYIAGMSAGASAANIIAGAYPDVFAAAGVHSGLPAGAAHTPAMAVLAMQQGAPGDRQTVAIPTIIFHGDADTVVHPRNGRFVAARSVAAFPPLEKTVRRGRSPGGRNYITSAHRTRNGKSYCEHWVIEGAGHAWSGGHPSGSYTDPTGPDASREMVRFFLKHRVPVRKRKAFNLVGR